jgi:hypothetical protein
MERGMKTMNWVQVFLYIRQPCQQFAIDKMSCIILSGYWFHIIILNVHVPTKDNIDGVKDGFCENFEWCSINSLNAILNFR